MSIIYKRLAINKTFWGIVKMKGKGWRIGFGRGFIEIFSGSSGIWLPQNLKEK